MHAFFLPLPRHSIQHYIALVALCHNQQFRKNLHAIHCSPNSCITATASMSCKPITIAKYGMYPRCFAHHHHISNANTLHNKIRREAILILKAMHNNAITTMSYFKALHSIGNLTPSHKFTVPS